VTTETPRVGLYTRLTEVLGPDHASTLMTYLPTDEPATRSDIQGLRSDIQSINTDLRSEMRESMTQLRSEIHELKTELRSEMQETKTELRSEMQKMRTELRLEMQDIKTDLRADIAAVRVDVREMDLRLGHRIDGIDARLNNHDIRFDNIHEAMRQQTRTFVFATTGTMVTLSAIAFGAAALI